VRSDVNEFRGFRESLNARARSLGRLAAGSDELKAKSEEESLCDQDFCLPFAAASGA